MKRRGRIFVLSSPSGGGKTTICRRLRRRKFNVGYSVSVTTRKRRNGERNGRDYIFLSRREFRGLLAKGNFLEWTDNFGDLYGTPRKFVVDTVSRGEDVILTIDVKGAMQVKRARADAVLIFLLPPSFALLQKRLRKRRTESGESVARRLKVARKELQFLKKYDYAVVNDNLTKAVDTIKAIVIAERKRIND